MARLLENGIDTRPFFASMSIQPEFHKIGLFNKEKMPNSEFLGYNGLYLPSGFNLSKEQISYICSCIKESTS